MRIQSSAPKGQSLLVHHTMLPSTCCQGVGQDGWELKSWRPLLLSDTCYA